MPQYQKEIGGVHGSGSPRPANNRHYRSSPAHNLCRKQSQIGVEKEIALEIWGTHTVYLGEPRKAIEFLKQSLSIGKAIENPRIIGFCEQKLKGLKGYDE